MYRMNELSYGILRGLNKVGTYFDDLTVYGSSIEKCYNNLYACLQRLSENNFYLNESKCYFFQEEVS